MLTSTVLSLAICTASVVAWAPQGHTMVGSIAQSFLSPSSAALLAKAVPAFNGDLSKMATWADTVKKSTAFSWSKNYHFSDTADSPPTACGYVDSRDCADGLCLTGAIANYTFKGMFPPFSQATR